MEADVVIIGTGPAGGMAALHLAQSGLKIIVLEKKTLPREKPCGGAVSKNVVSSLPWDTESLVVNQTNQIDFYYNFNRPKHYNSSDSPILMIDRPIFDYQIISRAITNSHGNMNLLENFKVKKVEENQKKVTIFGKNQETIKSNYLIAADGALSKTAKCLCLNTNQLFGSAISAKIKVPSEIFKKIKSHAVFNYYCIPSGYGWIFPKNDHLNCGVGIWKKKSVSQALDNFLSRSFPKGSIKIISRAAHPIPYYNGHDHIATKRTCLVGDAAGLVEPISGEGIRFALKSGKLAAEVILSLSTKNRNKSNTCLQYQKLIHKGIGKSLEVLYRLAFPVINQTPEFFYRKFVLDGFDYNVFYQKLDQRMENKHQSERLL